jgi:hypothetical protein
MTSSRGLALAGALALAALMPSTGFAQVPVAAAGASAQELETARALYKEGKELRARGDLAGALEKLRAAHALGNTPVTGIELARTYVMVGQIVEAREVCLDVLRLPVAADETEKSDAARSEAARLAEALNPRIPTLRVRIEGLLAGETAHLSVDGAAIPQAALGEAQKVDPGPHAVVVRVGEGAAAREIRSQVVVSEGQTGEVGVSVPPGPVVLAPAVVPPPAHSFRSGAWMVTVGFGSALAGGGVGALAGVLAWGKKNKVSRECPDMDCEAANGGTSDLAAARGAAAVSTVAFAVAGAGAFVGLIGLMTARRETASHAGPGVSPWIGLGAAGLHGGF